MRLALAIGLLSFAVAAEPHIPTPPPPWIEEARALYDRGRFDEARARFEKAYQLSGKPRLLFNIGQCYRLAGKPSDAVRTFRAFLRQEPSAPNRAMVEQLIAAEQKKLPPIPSPSPNK
jgi:Flp pilus assembly protein TadD